MTTAADTLLTYGYTLRDIEQYARQAVGHLRRRGIHLRPGDHFGIAYGAAS